MTAKKRGRKTNKKRARKGPKRGAARASTALRAGAIVTRKLSPATLKKRGLKLKAVGMRNGKKAYKLTKAKSSKKKATKGKTQYELYRSVSPNYGKPGQLSFGGMSYPMVSWTPEQLRQAKAALVREAMESHRRQRIADKEIEAVEEVLARNRGA